MPKTQIFNNGQEMLSSIQSGNDFYNPETKEYVFVCSDKGAICVYYLDTGKARELALTNIYDHDGEEYWGAFLGWGGEIYDPADELGSPDAYSADDWCNDAYSAKSWYNTVNLEKMLKENKELDFSVLIKKDKEVKDIFSELAKILKASSWGSVWSDGDKILCKTEDAANALATLIWQLYSDKGESITVKTGCCDPKEDELNEEIDKCTGWWYVNVE